MNVVEAVKLIVGECAKMIPDAQVVAPLAVWDNGAGGMGVQIKAPQMRGDQQCEITASFVLPRADLADALKIQAKGRVAVAAMLQDIQVQIKPVKQEKVA